MYVGICNCNVSTNIPYVMQDILFVVGSTVSQKFNNMTIGKPAVSGNKTHDEPILGNKTHDESVGPCNNTNDGTPATVRLDVMIVVVLSVAVISAGLSIFLFILFMIKCYRVKSNTEEPAQTYTVSV